jgi:hypothetical protein
VITDDKREFARLLQGVQTEVYQRPELTAAALGVWWAALSHIEMDVFRSALSAHVRTSKFPPTPADIVALVDGTSDDKAMAAWFKVRNAIGRAGQYNSVAFDDGCIHRAITDIGGWVRLCQTPEDELPFRQKDFIAAYKIAAQRGGGYPPRLAGVFEIDNAARGHKREPDTILIGDAATAMLVIQNGTTQDQAMGIVHMTHHITNHLKLEIQK